MKPLSSRSCGRAVSRSRTTAKSNKSTLRSLMVVTPWHIVPGNAVQGGGGGADRFCRHAANSRAASTTKATVRAWKRMKIRAGPERGRLRRQAEAGAQIEGRDDLAPRKNHAVDGRRGCAAPERCMLQHVDMQDFAAVESVERVGQLEEDVGF